MRGNYQELPVILRADEEAPEDVTSPIQHESSFPARPSSRWDLRAKRFYLTCVFLMAALIIVAVWFSTSKKSADRPSQQSFVFAVIGDWGRKGESNQGAVAEVMGRVCAQSRCSYVVNVGDNFYDNGVSSVTDPQFVQSFESIYTAPSLTNVPWLTTLGNHDYRGSVDAQLQYANVSTRWHLPSRYYLEHVDFEFKSSDGASSSASIDLFFLDTSPFILEYITDPPYLPPKSDVRSQDAAKQLEWFKAGVSSSTADWKIVVGHHPLYSAASTHGSMPEMRSAFEEVLNSAGVHAYFCGHDHQLQHLALPVAGRASHVGGGSPHYIVSGAGSRTRLDVNETDPNLLWWNGSSGFFLVSLSAAEMQLDAYLFTGEHVYNAHLPRS